MTEYMRVPDQDLHDVIRKEVQETDLQEQEYKAVMASEEACHRLRLYGDDQKRERKSGVSSSPFYPRLDEHFQEEICVHTGTQECVEFDWKCMPGR